MTNLAGVLQTLRHTKPGHHILKCIEHQAESSVIHRVASTDASDESKQLKRKAKQLKMSKQSIHHMREHVFWSTTGSPKKLRNKEVT